MEGQNPLPAAPSFPSLMPFTDPALILEFLYPNMIATKLPIVDYLGKPRPKLTNEIPPRSISHHDDFLDLAPS